VLRVKAVELLQQAGYTQRPVDWAHGMTWSNGYVDYVEKNDKPRPDWNAIASGRPTPVEYWYRQAQDYLVGRTFLGSNFPSDIHWNEPPHTRPGMIRVSMDAQGRLKYLLAMPPERDDTPLKTPYDWNVLIKAAGFDPAQLQPAEPQWNSLAASDARAAWTGVYPGPKKRPVRLEAASWRGKPVFFRVVEPWDEPQRADARPPTAGEQVRNVINVALLLGALTLAVVLGWRNYRLGRGDLRGASRLALLILAAQLAVWVFGGHHVPHFWLLATFTMALSFALFFAAVAWVLYLALEPYVRRRWPQTLISWSRLFAGRVRDPLVGSDILYGLVLAVIWGLLFEVRFQVASYFGGPPNRNNLEWIESSGSAMASWVRHIPQAVQGGLLFFFLLFVMRVVLRKQWLAVAAFALLFTVPAALDSNQPWADFPIFVVIYGTAAYFLVRFGLVTLGAAVFGVDVMLNVPFTFDPSSWYFGTSVAVLLSMVALAVFAFHTAMAGRPLLKEEWFG
jgi:serine/threonine-protein kinase